MKAYAQIQNLNYKIGQFQGAVKGKKSKKPAISSSWKKSGLLAGNAEDPEMDEDLQEANDTNSGKGLSRRKAAEIAQMLGSEEVVEVIQTPETAEETQAAALSESTASETASAAGEKETGYMMLRGEPVNLRQAILAAEILGEPVSKKRRAGRRHGY